jgi:outer membrane lipoprotein SlyB
MDNNTSRPTLHPALMIAAASVTALSLAGVGVLTGVIPFNHKAAEPVAAAAPTSAPLVTAPQASPVAAAPAVAVTISNSSAPAPVVAKASTPKPVKVARAAEPADIDVYRYDRPPVQMRTATPVATPVVAPATCHNCGTIESVHEATKEAEASGVGAVAGGVLGGVLGNQVGNGRGRDLATVLGAIGGAVAGHKVEQAQKRVVQYEVTVRFEDGTSRVFNQDTPPAWRSGDRVKVENGLLISRA